jgi:hypothetical protein
VNAAPEIADGMHFSLPADVYHSVPALSSSGIKNLLISGPDFWYRTSWLNPDHVDEETEAMVIGRAYHKRILEGRDAFRADYAPTFEPPPDSLRTVDDIKDALIKHGVEKPKGLKGELIEQLLEIQPNALILDELRADYETLHHGKELLSHNLIASIETAAKMIECHPENKKLVSGGFPEVSVIWTSDDIRFKARFDYLKPKAIVDLKTFGNFMNKPIDAAIYSAMASGKYHIQAAFYMRAFQAAQAAAKPKDFPGPDGWLRQFTDAEEPGFYFLWQQKGVAPLARAKKFTRGSIWSCGEVAIDEAIRRFRHYMEKYGELPWVDDAVIEDFQDDHFPAYTTEL